MRKSDDGDIAALKRLKDGYEIDYDPETNKTTESIKKETDGIKDKNE